MEIHLRTPEEVRQILNSGLTQLRPVTTKLIMLENNTKGQQFPFTFTRLADETHLNQTNPNTGKLFTPTEYLLLLNLCGLDSSLNSSEPNLTTS